MPLLSPAFIVVVVTGGIGTNSSSPGPFPSGTTTVTFVPFDKGYCNCIPGAAPSGKTTLKVAGACVVNAAVSF